MEALVIFVLVSLLSLLGYVVKRGLDMVQFLIGMPINSRPAYAKHKEEKEEKEKIIDESSFEYEDGGSVIAEHVLDRHKKAQEKADQIRAELNAIAQDPRAGVYPVDHTTIDSTYIPRPTEEYAQ